MDFVLCQRLVQFRKLDQSACETGPVACACLGLQPILARSGQPGKHHPRRVFGADPRPQKRPVRADAAHPAENLPGLAHGIGRARRPSAQSDPLQESIGVSGARAQDCVSRHTRLEQVIRVWKLYLDREYHIHPLFFCLHIFRGELCI